MVLIHGIVPALSVFQILQQGSKVDFLMCAFKMNAEAVFRQNTCNKEGTIAV